MPFSCLLFGRNAVVRNSGPNSVRRAKKRATSAPTRTIEASATDRLPLEGKLHPPAEAYAARSQVQSFTIARKWPSRTRFMDLEGAEAIPQPTSSRVRCKSRDADTMDAGLLVQVQSRFTCGIGNDCTAIARLASTVNRAGSCPSRKFRLRCLTCTYHSRIISYPPCYFFFYAHFLQR